jgi:hypothetical protein
VLGAVHHQVHHIAPAVAVGQQLELQGKRVIVS